MNSIILFSSICGFTAAISWGVADFFAAKASKSNSAESTVLWVSLIGVIIYSLFYSVNQGDSLWAINGILFGVSAGLLWGLGLLLFYRGLEIGPVSLVSPIGGAYPLITTIIVIVIFGETLTTTQIVGIILIVFGITVASGIYEFKKSKQKIAKGVMYGILTFIAWGIAFALLGESVSSLGWQKAAFLEIWSQLLMVVVLLPILLGRKVYSIQKPSLLKNKYILGAALLQLFGLVVFDIGLSSTTSSAVITAISASYPALTIFLAIKHLKEKNKIIQLMGAFITVIGVIILSI